MWGGGGGVCGGEGEECVWGGGGGVWGGGGGVWGGGGECVWGEGRSAFVYTYTLLSTWEGSTGDICVMMSSGEGLLPRLELLLVFFYLPPLLVHLLLQDVYPLLQFLTRKVLLQPGISLFPSMQNTSQRQKRG